MDADAYVAPIEFKFTADAATGQFSGYGAVFGNVDSHGDLIQPGAFTESLAERKAQGRPIPMHVMHGIFGGDGIPVGVWSNVQEDDKGLKVDGKISGMNTDAGRLLYERVKDGALGGLSIGYRVKKNGAVYGSQPGEPKRTLKALDLGEISLVDDPSNAAARVREVKAMLAVADKDKVAAALAAAIALHQTAMTGGDSPTAAERAAMLNHLQDAHEALTGNRMPAGMKSRPTTIREFERLLRDGGFSNSEARALAEHGFKSQPREEGRDQATAANPLEGLELGGFSLPKFKD